MSIEDIDLKEYPTSPGVYLMKDAGGLVLYVGKAVNIRSRLRSYFSGSDDRVQIKFLLPKVDRIDFIVTDTEKEALLLENSLIKEHRPRYNINLRDDKTYVSLRLNLKEEFPTLEIVRQVDHRDGALYFGPYSSSGAVKETLKLIFRIFPLRHFAGERCFKRSRPCLYHQIGQCSAPCHGKISKVAYRQHVDTVIDLLKGREKDIVVRLQNEMTTASAEMRFEEAARLRDQIKAIEHIAEQQKMVDASGEDIDICGLVRESGEIIISILHVRAGKLIGSHTYPIEWRLAEQELLASFLNEHYTRSVIIPDRILLPFLPEGVEPFAEMLHEKRGKLVQVTVPQRGEKAKLLALAEKNAARFHQDRETRRNSTRAMLTELQERLHLRKFPNRIDCFDISNFQGGESVGSMAVVVDGETANKLYRRYKITTVEGADDFTSLYEVIGRRLSRGKEEGDLPDMLLIDGGRGQLGAAERALEETGLSDIIDLVSIAKSRAESDMQSSEVKRSEERFFRPSRKNPIMLRQGASALFLLQRLRDEAHRFAIEYHRSLRRKRTLKSSLEDIPGVGKRRSKDLLRHFGSLKRIRSASLTELTAMPGLPKSIAEAIFTHFNS